MNNLGEFPEGWLARVFRYFAYSLFGALLGSGPAAWLTASTRSDPIQWHIPIEIVVGSGVFFLLLGIVTRGRFFGWLLQLLGRRF